MCWRDGGLEENKKGFGGHRIGGGFCSEDSKQNHYFLFPHLALCTSLPVVAVMPSTRNSIDFCGKVEHKVALYNSSIVSSRLKEAGLRIGR